MNKYLLGVLIGLGTIGTTYASIVSRGFLDEQLTNYATTTALDLKANQSDLTNLSNIVGDPPRMTYQDIVNANTVLDKIMGSSYYDTYRDILIPTNNISELIYLNYGNAEFPGLSGVTEALFDRRDSLDEWPVRLNGIFTDYEWLYNGSDRKKTSFCDLLFYGGNMSDGVHSSGNRTTVYGLPKLTEEVDKIPVLTESVNANTAKIGTLPDGYETVGDALTAINAKVDNKIENLSETASAGKYVLTAVRVGDQTTYAWELIDRSESEATTTTTTE